METQAYLLGYKKGFIIGCDEGMKTIPEQLYEEMINTFGEVYAQEYKDGYTIGYKEGYWNG